MPTGAKWCYVCLHKLIKLTCIRESCEPSQHPSFYHNGFSLYHHDTNVLIDPYKASNVHFLQRGHAMSGIMLAYRRNTDKCGV